MIEMQVVDCILGKLPCCMTWFGAHTPVLTSLGSVENDPSGKNITKVCDITPHYFFNRIFSDLEKSFLVYELLRTVIPLISCCGWVFLWLMFLSIRSGQSGGCPTTITKTTPSS